MHKRTLDDLAILGGPQALAEPLHVGGPNLGDNDRFLARIQDILQRRRLTNNGPYVREFEDKVAELAGTKHCIAVCNGTTAIEITVRALGLTGEIILPAFTFVATAHALQWQELTPIFADIDPETWNVAPESVERLITPKTSAILGVHLWGRPCDTAALERIAAKHGLAVLYDACHAFGCTHSGRGIGGFGNASMFSFHATKFVNAAEGGAIVTDDDELAERARFMRNFGFAGRDQVNYIGINGKMNELCAALGVTSLESMDDFIATNRVNYEKYRDRLTSLPGLSVRPYDEAERCNYQYVAVELGADEFGLDRDVLVRVLECENVLARRYFYPGCHRMVPYRDQFPQRALPLPVTDRVARRVLCLPTGTAASVDAVTAICDLLRFVGSHAAELRERLEKAEVEVSPASSVAELVPHRPTAY